MKKVYLLLALIIFSFSQLFSQQYIDVVYLKNGSIIRGIILEQIPNQTIKIQTADKSLFVYKMDEVEKILKEETSTVSNNSSSQSASDGPQSYAINIKCGLLLTGPGNVNVAGHEYKVALSPLAKIDADGILVPKLSMGASIIVGVIKVEEFNNAGSYMSFGGTIKPRFMVNNEIQVRPGLFVGYNYISHSSWDSHSNGLNIGGQFEVAKEMAIGYTFVGEFGFISQPVGGNDDVSIAMIPIFYILFGFQFGK